MYLIISASPDMDWIW